MSRLAYYPRYLVDGPTGDVVTVDEVRAMLGYGADDPSDDLLTAFIRAVVGTLDPASGGWLGRALAQQQWELRLPGFPSCPIELPFPPLIAVLGIVYDDANGVEQTAVEGTDYRVFAGGNGRARVEPISANNSFPTASTEPESVRITYVAGYEVGLTPQPIKAAIALGVKHLISTSEQNLYLARDEVPGVAVQQFVVSEAAGKAIETAIGGLLAPFQVMPT